MHVLHTRYLKALRDGEDLFAVSNELEAQLHKWETDLKNDFYEAKALQMRLSLPTDHPVRIATLQYIDSILSATEQNKEGSDDDQD